MKTMPSVLLSVILVCTTGLAQWTTQPSGTTARLRGVSAASKSVVWASGSGGTFARTTDGGATWHSTVMPGAGGLDFRDVEAVDANTAYLLSIGPGEQSRIYKTTSGGSDWTLQFTNHNAKAFFDAYAFWDARTGIAMSDPVDGRFILIKTTDGGANWKELSRENLPPALEGEGGFAASGTCIAVEGSKNVWFATGGASVARVFRSTDDGASWKVATTPITAGNASSGIFSIAFKDAKHGVIVGGDYKKEAEGGDNVAMTTDGGATWTLAKGPRPSGFRSAVAYVPDSRKRVLVAVGPSGSDYSTDDGASWSSIESPGYHALSFARASADGWAVGETGRIGKLASRLPKNK
ncbi:MAG TPA: glycosyl hydrolase [Blastocatellia bacterium]|nr:glycosyl hydrolase [Blastocatellia bacterium]